MSFRNLLVSRLRKIWPSDITVDGEARTDLHLGIDPDREVQGETVQFAVCAAGRLVHYVLTGTIAAHLQRNSLVAKRAALQAKPTQEEVAAILKRPAAK